MWEGFEDNNQELGEFAFVAGYYAHRLGLENQYWNYPLLWYDIYGKYIPEYDIPAIIETLGGESVVDDFEEYKAAHWEDFTYNPVLWPDDDVGDSN